MKKEIEIDREMLIGGVKINYFYHCKRQLWFFSKFITMEHTSDYVMVGKLINQLSFSTITKDLLIDDKIRIDFVYKKNKVVINEIKKSNKFKIAHIFQLLYYLWYFKNVKGVNAEGLIRYPKLKKIEKVKLTKENEFEIFKVIQKINKLTSLPTPPKPIKKPFCKKCSYYELCFV